MMDMDNENPKQRPNANYKLSKPDNEKEPINEDQLVYHYNRENRLAKAPQSVKDLYVEKKQSRFNLIAPLVSSKPKAMLFFTIIALCVLILILSVLGKLDNSYLLDGNNIEIKGTRYEDMVIILMRKSIKKGSIGHSSAVEIAVSPVSQEEDFPVFYHRVFFTLEPEEEYRFAVPFNSPQLVMVLQTERSSLKLTLKPE